MKKKKLTLPVKFQYHLIFEFSLPVISFCVFWNEQSMVMHANLSLFTLSLCVFWNEQSMVMHANLSLFIIFLSPLIFDT